MECILGISYAAKTNSDFLPQGTDLQFSSTKHQELFCNVWDVLQGQFGFGPAIDSGHKHEAAKAVRHRRRAQNSPNPGDSSTDSGEESEVGPQCALTVAALQEMDDANARDWRQLKKTRRLAGVKGHLHAAKRILDAEREQRHPDRKLAKRKQVRCNAPWARQFVPGAVESGGELGVRGARPPPFLRSNLPLSVWPAPSKIQTEYMGQQS